MTKNEKNGISFSDVETFSLDVNNIDDLHTLIVEKLCGKRYLENLLKERDNELIQDYIKCLKDGKLFYSKFNELLLLFNQHKISEGFYNFFFGDEVSTMNDLKFGIIKFRGFALLCFGNIRYAYKSLKEKNEQAIYSRLLPFSRSSKELLMLFTQREQNKLKIEEIEKDKTWLNGFIAKSKFDSETIKCNKFIGKENKTSLNKTDLQVLLKKINKLQVEYSDVVRKALKNTDKYLTWDCIDVYIATSMRNKWEFESVSQFIKTIFSDKLLIPLKLRYFDPTQSQCSNRFDKGLVESLILKRSKCTLYMSQEGDTLGKDSELAVTLAQGKPVIAYVPSIDVKKRIRKLEKYPLEYFQTMFYKFKANGFIDREDVKEILSKVDVNYHKKIYYDFLNKVDQYRNKQPFTLFEEKDEKMKENNYELFNLMCKLLSNLEKTFYDLRARTLKQVHPLAMQVNLRNGVANGLIVSRNEEECARILRAIVINELCFSINYYQEESKELGKSSYYLLEEQNTDCPFRIETCYNKLTNSYWNTYLEDEGESK